MHWVGFFSELVCSTNGNVSLKSKGAGRGTKTGSWKRLKQSWVSAECADDPLLWLTASTCFTVCVLTDRLSPRPPCGHLTVFFVLIFLFFFSSQSFSLSHPEMINWFSHCVCLTPARAARPAVHFIDRHRTIMAGSQSWFMSSDRRIQVTDSQPEPERNLMISGRIFNEQTCSHWRRWADRTTGLLPVADGAAVTFSRAEHGVQIGRIDCFWLLAGSVFNPVTPQPEGLGWKPCRQLALRLPARPPRVWTGLLRVFAVFLCWLPDRILQYRVGEGWIMQIIFVHSLLLNCW